MPGLYTYGTKRLWLWDLERNCVVRDCCGEREKVRGRASSKHAKVGSRSEATID
jgi:hypothetical protein